MLEPNVLRGKPPFGSKQTIELCVIEFVFTHLARWRDDPTRSVELAEPQLNAQLSSYLNKTSHREGFPFFFQREQPQVGRRTVDLTATPDDELVALGYFGSSYDEIVVFEAKRLPAPTQNRQQEYVTGGAREISGGIQRFKACVHGHKHNISAIIGYIQSQSTNFFFSEINSWISGLCYNQCDCVNWSLEEQLHEFEEYENGTSKSISIHQRTHSGPITLHHLWVVM